MMEKAERRRQGVDTKQQARSRPKKAFLDVSYVEWVFTVPFAPAKRCTGLLYFVLYGHL
jgi:hypothetical protein